MRVPAEAMRMAAPRGHEVDEAREAQDDRHADEDDHDVQQQRLQAGAPLVAPQHRRRLPEEGVLRCQGASAFRTCGPYSRMCALPPPPESPFVQSVRIRRSEQRFILL